MRILSAVPVLIVALSIVAGAGATTKTTAQAHVSCAGAISWKNARGHVGRVMTVRGRVAGTYYASSSNGEPTFLNLGADYPSSRRVTIVIWGENRHRFGAPERRYARRTICVRGLIRPYAGIVEVFASSPSQIATP
jgi:hypothetical protein